METKNSFLDQHSDLMEFENKFELISIPYNNASNYMYFS